MFLTLYGASLGFGLVTLFTHATVYVALALALVIPSAAVAIGVVFGLSKALAVGLAAAMSRGHAAGTLTWRIKGADPFVRRLNAGYLLGTAVSVALLARV